MIDAQSGPRTGHARSLLLGVRPSDPLTLLGVLGIAPGVTALACVLPGRRAAATHPMHTLRDE